MMEYKSATTGALLAHDDEQGIVEALVSITGVADRQDDIVVPGAYADTLRERKMKGVRHHDWTRPVAKTLIQEEWLPGDARLPKTLPNGDPWPAEAGALYVKGQYNLAVQDGRDAYETAKFYGDEGQWSIGYRPAKGGARRDKTGKRLLAKVDLYEWSDVLHGAAPLSTTLAVKTANSQPDATEEVEEEEPTGFVDPDDDGLEGKFDASQPRAADGEWSRGGGGGKKPAGKKPADGDTADGLPSNWLERVLAGDPKYVEPASGGRGRGGGGGGKEKEKKPAESDADKEQAAEQERRARVDEALKKEQAAEKERRAAFERDLPNAPESARAGMRDAETRRQRDWQESFDAARDEERSHRRKWNTEQRKRRGEEKQAGGKKSAGWDEDLTGLGGAVDADEALFADVEPAASEKIEDVEVKVMDVISGSFEERRERLQEAVRAALGAQRSDGNDSVWVWIVGTFNDRVIATRRAEGEPVRTVEIGYTIDDGKIVLGEPEEVEVVATVRRGTQSTKTAAARLIAQASEMLALDAADGDPVEGKGDEWDAERRLLVDAHANLTAAIGDGGGGESGDGGDESGTKGDRDGIETTDGNDGTEAKVLVDADQIRAQLAALTADL